jgi:hypothetical protein
MGRDVQVGAQLVELAVTVGRAWLWLLAPAGLVMLGYRIARPVGESRAGWIALAASLAIAGPILVTRFDIEPRDLGLYVIHRFHVLPIVLLAIPTGALTIIGFVAIVVTSLPELARFHSPAMNNGIHGMLAGFPKDAIVFVTTDEFDVGFHYFELARGERPDVLSFRTGFVGASWYRARIPLPLEPGMTKIQIADVALATGRPLFVNRGEREIIGAFPVSAFGPFVRVYPRGSAVPSLDEVVAQNRTLFEHIDLDYAPPGKDDELAMATHYRYMQVWRRIGDAYRAQGRDDDAARAYALADQLAPR